MKKELHVLVVEDSQDDAELLLRVLRRGDYEIVYERVETAQAMRDALARARWDIVLSDYSMPEFSGPQALELLKASGVDVPFIIISGTIGEETAVDALKAGANDFLVKGRLARLWPAIERELRDAETRRQRRLAESALRVSEERFRTLVESIDDVVFTLDRGMRYDGVFGKWVAREGITPDYLLGKTAREVAAHPALERHESAVRRALDGEASTYEWTSATPERRHFQTSLSPRRDDSGVVTGVVGVSRDITDVKHAQTQLAAADRMASVGVLAAGVGHEINSPLAALLANIDVALQDARVLAERSDAGQQVADLVAGLTDARDAALRIRDIVQDLRLFSREREASGPVDVERVLESSLRMAWNEIRHRATLTRQLSPVPLVEANESRLGQVFLNLLINAAQAMPEGHAHENTIRVVTGVSPEGDVVVEVHDSGSGIDPADLGSVFTPFFTTKPVGIGTGLGLPICHRIVTSLGGRIMVQSRPGKGSVFTVHLPPSQSQTKSSAPPSRPAPTSIRRGRVLVVDDDRMVTSAIRRSLRRDHDVEELSDPRVALQRLVAGEHFDVILCDLMMPEMSGMELHAELTRAVPEQAGRMVFLTGGAFTPSAREFVASVANRCIDKPFDVADLRALVGERVQ